MGNRKGKRARKTGLSLEERWLSWCAIKDPFFRFNLGFDFCPMAFIVVAISFFVGWKEISNRPQLHAENKP